MRARCQSETNVLGECEAGEDEDALGWIAGAWVAQMSVAGMPQVKTGIQKLPPNAAIVLWDVGGRFFYVYEAKVRQRGGSPRIDPLD